MLHTTLQRLGYHDQYQQQIPGLISKLPRTYNLKEEIPFDVILNAIYNEDDPFTFSKNLWFLRAEHQHVNLYRKYAVEQIKKTNTADNHYPEILAKAIEVIERFIQTTSTYESALLAINSNANSVSQNPVTAEFIRTLENALALSAIEINSKIVDARFETYGDVIPAETLALIKGAALLGNNYEDLFSLVSAVAYDLTNIFVTDDFTDKYIQVALQQKNELIQMFSLYQASPGEKAFLV